ncbi:MAG: LacI family DNA-binding transcriptional regulator [Bacillota bacterium]
MKIKVVYFKKRNRNRLRKRRNMSISINEIAKKANVSKATVSRVLNDKPDVSDRTREKIFKIIEENNYVPNESARNLSLGIVNTVAMIVPSDNPSYINIIKRVNKRLFEKNMDLLFYVTNHNSELELKQLKKLEEKNLAGLIYIKSLESSNSDVEKYLDELNFPILLINSKIDVDLHFDQICYDEFDISYTCVQKLVDAEHKNISILSTPLNLNYEKTRYNGILKALNDNNISIDKTNVYYPEEITIQEGYRLSKEILKGDNKVICSLSNILTLGLIKAINEMNLKISDYSIISYGELDTLNKVGYNLSTIWLSVDDLVEKIIKTIFYRMKNPNKDSKKVILDKQINLKGSER